LLRLLRQDCRAPSALSQESARDPGTTPRGPDAPHFWQKGTPDNHPDWITRVGLPSEQGKPVRYAVVSDRSKLPYLVNQGTITFLV
jgi:DNA primase